MCAPDIRSVTSVTAGKDASDDEHLGIVNDGAAQAMVRLAGPWLGGIPFDPGKGWESENIDVVEAGRVLRKTCSPIYVYIV